MTSANTLETMVHPVLALRSARSGSPTAGSARTTNRGHPMWRLVHQLRSTQLHRTTQLHALSMESATSVVKQAITPVSAPEPASSSECSTTCWRQQQQQQPWQASPEGLHHQTRSSRDSWSCESDCR